MSIKRYKPEKIVDLLRQIEMEIANGKTTPQACRDAQILFCRPWGSSAGGTNRSCPPRFVASPSH
jgi:hypothetical protein